MDSQDLKSGPVGGEVMSSAMAVLGRMDSRVRVGGKKKIVPMNPFEG